MAIMSRRRFLGLGGIALGGTLLGSRFFGPFNLIPTASGQELPQLAELKVRRTEANFVQASLIATPAAVSVGGVTAKLLTYNNSFPGPLLRLREGDRVQLHFNNQLDVHTNLHLHGLHLSPKTDDPFRHGHPGDMVIYEFDMPPGSAGTYWYHPHVHGQVGEQLFSGMAGAIVVEGPLDSMPELQAAQDQLLVLKDITLAGVEAAPHLPWDIGGKVGNLMTVNGAVQPILTATKGTLRLRLLNASTAHFFEVALEGQTLHQIASDGGMLEQPVAIKSIRLAPGERAEVLVQIEQAGSYKLTDGANTLLTINAPQNLSPTPLPTRLATLEKLDPNKATVRRQVVFATAGLGQFQINGRFFDMNRVDFRAKLGDLEIWELHNAHVIDHPFHLHSYPFQIISRDGVAEPYTAWHDTINLKAGQRVNIAIPFRDFGGRTVFHCHIAEHEDVGMMSIVEIA